MLVAGVRHSHEIQLRETGIYFRLLFLNVIPVVEFLCHSYIFFCGRLNKIEIKEFKDWINLY